MTFKKRFAFIMAIWAMLALSGCAQKQSPNGQERTAFANALFSMSLPEELEGLYEADIADNAISVYHTASKEANCGGFAFEVSAQKDPSYFASGMAVKVGELKGANGTVYDIALTYPSDVQYDFTDEKAIQDYQKLYDAAQEVVKTLTGVNGYSYTYGAGMKGEDLYNDVLEKHVKAVREGWDASKLEQEDMSTMYYLIGVFNDDPVLDRIGYAYYDVNGDGVEELLFGEITDGPWGKVIYDIYTMVDRAPAHVVSGWDRNRYYALEGTLLINEASGGAAESSYIVYNLEANSAALYPQVGFKYDGYTNEEQPWFISYSVSEDEWENVTEDEWIAYKANFEDYVDPAYTPLSEWDGLKQLGYTPEDLVGTWEEKFDGQRQITIAESSEAGKYDISVRENNGENTWEMTGIPLGDGGTLRYYNGKRVAHTEAAGEADEKTTCYENGSGLFYLSSTYEVLWDDDVEHAGDNAVFVRIS